MERLATLHQGRDVTSLGQYSAAKKITVSKEAGHYIRDERSQIQDNILLFKTISVGREVGHCIKNEKLQIQDSILL